MTTSTRFPGLHTLWETVVDFLFPACCPLCEALLDAGQVVCLDCRADLLPLPPDRCSICAEPFARRQGLLSRCQNCLDDPPDFEEVFAVGLHAGRLQKAVSGLKYGGRVQLDRSLARLLSEVVPATLWPSLEGLVPVPLLPERLRERMYNQSHLLCRALSTLYGLPLVVCLDRLPGGQAQQGLTAAERTRNLRNQILARSGVGGKTLLLVDDVCTTGATLRACSRALKQAGAARVYALVVTRADRRYASPAKGVCHGTSPYSADASHS